MDEKICIRMLQEHGVKPTSNRIVIAKTLAKCHSPQSMRELESTILTIDKSNIFRTLSLFREHHLVHVIEDGEGCTKYELCYSHDHDEDEDEHVHFFCERCHKVVCLLDTPVPTVSLPRGYELTGTNFLVKGLCPDCAKKL